MPKNHIVIGLDIGTSAIKVIAISKKNGEADFEVLAQSERPSFGIRRGVVVNVDEVAKNIGEVLTQLQEEIGHKLADVYINIGGSHIFSTPSRGTVIVSRADKKISEEDINRVISAAQAISLPSNKEILDVFPREFIIDGQGQVKNPQDMQGLRLEAEVLVICAFSPYLKNLTTAVLNTGFQISNITLSSLASAKATLTPQQKELGVCLIDIGAGTTDMAVFEEGDLIHTAVFPLGSERITYDLAVGLKTDIEVAEQIKREFGSCLLVGGNKTEKIKLPNGNGEMLTFTHKMLVNIIGARVSEIFDLVENELKQISLQGLLPAGIVLTGGGAKLPRMVELAKKELKLPVRLGVARGLAGLTEDTSLSTVLGLALLGQELEDGEGGGSSTMGKGIFAKVIGKSKKLFQIFVP